MTITSLTEMMHTAGIRPFWAQSKNQFGASNKRTPALTMHKKQCKNLHANYF